MSWTRCEQVNRWTGSCLSLQVLHQDGQSEASHQRLLLRVLQRGGGEELLSWFLGSRLYWWVHWHLQVFMVRLTWCDTLNHSEALVVLMPRLSSTPAQQVPPRRFTGRSNEMIKERFVDPLAEWWGDQMYMVHPLGSRDVINTPENQEIGQFEESLQILFVVKSQEKTRGTTSEPWCHGQDRGQGS